MRIRVLPPLLVALAAACSPDPQQGAPLSPATAAARGDAAGAVVVASNAADANALLVFPRQRDGSLGEATAYTTGGKGAGAGLGNQGGVALTDDGLILVVNAGSNDVSVFRRGPSGLTLVDREPSGGERPISVTSQGGLVFVLNAGGDGNITGFTLRENGRLAPLPHSTRPLSNAAAGPAQIGFSPDGRRLVVTEKTTNRITEYNVTGRFVGQPESHAASGMTPFGFSFDRQGRLLVSEAFGGSPGESALSSYRFGHLRGFEVISSSVASSQTAACWVAVSPNGQYAYVTNTGSATVTGYRIGPVGDVSLLNPDGVTAITGATPIDLAFAGRGELLYTLNSGGHTITGFGVREDGSLASVGTPASVPEGTNGMVAW